MEALSYNILLCPNFAPVSVFLPLPQDSAFSPPFDCNLIVSNQWLPHLLPTFLFPTDSKGRIYYENHATESTTWLHPVKLAELQTAGLVAPSTSSAPFVELSKDEDVDQKRLCPEAVVRGRDGREGAPFRKVSTGTVDGVMLPEEEEYT